MADGEFHSGTELAETLGVSRSAICKQLKHLTELGIEFNAISGKGYRLESVLQLLSNTSIEKYLSSTTRSLIKELEIHHTISSTNSYLVEKSLQSKQTGIVCLAEYQNCW